MPKNKQISAHLQDEANQWIFVAPETALRCQEGNGADPALIKIPHPKTGKELQFLLSSSGQKIFEILRFKEEPRSWFVEDSVQKDGSLFVITPIDPLFLILPYLSKFSQKFRTLEQILLDEGHPSISRINACVTSEELLSICDVKGDEVLQVYRLNSEKVMEWLKFKVEQTADSISSSGVHASKGSQSATFVRSKRRSETSRADYVRYAFGLLCDYLTSHWCEKLKESLSIADEEQLSSPEGPPAKRTRVADEIPEAAEDYSKEFGKVSNKMESEKSSTKLTTAQRSLSKVDKTGMKALSSFFGSGVKKARKR